MTVTTQPTLRNGVDTAALFATIDVVGANRDLAKFQFRARNTWISGTHNRSEINGYYGAGQQHHRAESFRYDVDHPPVLTGNDHGPAPVEYHVGDRGFAGVFPTHDDQACVWLCRPLD